MTTNAEQQRRERIDRLLTAAEFWVKSVARDVGQVPPWSTQVELDRALAASRAGLAARLHEFIEGM